MDLVKLSKRVGNFLRQEDIQSVSDVYTHLQNDVFLKEVISHLDGLQFVKLIFLTSWYLDGKNPEDLVPVLDKNLFLFSIIDFGDDPQITCSDCNGDGSVFCDDCDGNGQVDCNNCDGSGKVECPDCDGTGQEDVDNPESDSCSNCDGKGEIDCSACDGEGRESCQTCDGDGSESCYECSGSGHNYESGANYDIDMYASYNPILKDVVEKHLLERKPFEVHEIEKKQTFFFKRYSLHDDSDNTEINTEFQNTSYVNSLETDPEEIDYLHRNSRDNRLTFSDFEEVNEFFK